MSKAMRIFILIRSLWRFQFTDWARGWECCRLHPKPSDDRKLLYHCCRFAGHFGPHRTVEGKEF